MTILGHFVRAEISGTWISGYIPSIADWQSFDVRSCQSVNGDHGGTWAPLEPIVINGAGMQVTGPTLVTGVGGILQGGAAAAFLLSDDRQIVLGPTHAKRKRTILSSTLRAMVDTEATVGPSQVPPIIPNLAFASAQTVIVPKSQVTLTVPLRVHDGAALTSVTVNWIVSTLHQPTTLPKFRVLATLTDGTTIAVSSPATGADADGYFSPSASSAAGWFNNGQPQSLTLPVDGGPLGITYGDSTTPQLQIDIGNVTYALEIQEERGATGAPFSATVYAQNAQLVATTNVTPSGSTTVIDGVTAAANAVVLLTNQNDPTQNGIWAVQSSGSWVRFAVAFSAGAIFYVNGSGTQLNGTYWQAAPTGGIVGLRLWVNGTVLAAGTQWAPVNGAIGLIAVVTQQGTTGSTEPIWPTIPGQTVTDGSVIWTMQANPCAAPDGIPQMLDPSLLNTGCSAGFATFGNIWLPVACNFEQIADCRFE